MEKGGEEMERQEGMQVPSRGFCDTTESPSTSCSPDADQNRALPNARPHHRRHIVVTTPPPTPIIHHCAPETELQQLGFGFLALNPQPRLAQPNARPHHCHHLVATTPPPPPIIQQHYFQRRAPNRALPNARPHHHRHLVITTPPPPPITHHCYFQQHAPNRALVGRFWVFDPKPTTPACAAQHATPPPPSPHPPHPTTSPHRPPLPFHTVRPKPSYNSSVSRFWPKPPPRASRFQPNGHTTTATTTTPSHHPSTSSPAAVSHSVPETEP
ncbi:hypothetical protein PILCRDRAFT_15690 [Piloderma croceum F 1598]|uniref:Uncharacterized protein n=1 Tax=Piloderma croceum (strain F 1598) TaxID=765440 RepID=A0A0C3EY76_PILCF|nr:hypothetical protein PILCRDRAFT_15690 [Piloderma croceum F 1598]